MNRRDFLRSRHVARMAGQALAALDKTSQLFIHPSSFILHPSEEIALLRMARRAMATTFEVLVPFGTPDALEWAEVALDRIDELEAQLTVYRDSSEVSQLNRVATQVDTGSISGAVYDKRFSGARSPSWAQAVQR